jgi:acyl carrier protein
MTRQELMSELESIINAEPGSLSEDTPIEGLRGWDSLKNVEFRMFVEDELGRELDGLKVDQAGSIGDLVALVADLLED